MSVPSRAIVVIGVFATALGSPTAVTARAHFAISTAQAPMDRYFGRLKFSPLGVGNTISLISGEVDEKRLDSSQAVSSLAFTEDAVRDWQAKFPADRWLPRTVLSIGRVYHKFDDPVGRKNEKRIDTWILLHFPASNEARALLRAAIDAPTALPSPPAATPTPEVSAAP